MRNFLPYAAFAATVALAGPGLAQSSSSQYGTPPSASTPSTTSPSTMPGMSHRTSPGSTATSPSGTDAAANASAGSMVSAGMSVKDSTGTTIGSVTDVKNDLATIKMGSDSFSVETSKLAVQNGSATINATQAEIKKMMPPKK